MGNGGFDPSLFHDTDGRKYYIYRRGGRAITATPITPL
jgi:xylan 1,4-beta-xylosidase